MRKLISEIYRAVEQYVPLIETSLKVTSEEIGVRPIRVSGVAPRMTVQAVDAGFSLIKYKDCHVGIAAVASAIYEDSIKMTYDIKSVLINDTKHSKLIITYISRNMELEAITNSTDMVLLDGSLTFPDYVTTQSDELEAAVARFETLFMEKVRQVPILSIVKDMFRSKYITNLREDGRFTAPKIPEYLLASQLLSQCERPCYLPPVKVNSAISMRTSINIYGTYINIGNIFYSEFNEKTYNNIENILYNVNKLSKKGYPFLLLLVDRVAKVTRGLTVTARLFLERLASGSGVFSELRRNEL